MAEVSPKQLEANRKNAKLGGVKTEESKAVSRYNALKHGILSNITLLNGENERTFIKLQKRLRNGIKPIGELEALLTDRIISNVWRLRRLLMTEKATMEWQASQEYNWTINKGKAYAETSATRKLLVNDDMEKLLRYEITIERGLYRALHELQRLQLARTGIKMPIPVAIDIDISKE